MFNKILIANRGEIAVRLIRACHEMGIAAVAVYSDADKNALHTRMADEVYYIGKSPAVESYLVKEKIVEIAHTAQVEAIHPGYGFLAENADFARLCAESNIVFIGPSSKAINLLGDKIESKTTMAAAGIPVVPGSDGTVAGPEAAAIAEKLGYPILIKAAGGGGGKGMRVVRGRNELEPALQRATSEAQAAFDNPTVFIEKLLDAPRHIEFQILADDHGNVVHLFERECSVQRRHQKLIEEAPSAVVNNQLRDRMGEAAVKAVKAAGYSSAGTVEFMVDASGDFYFLEMNTRLQVEHPVTELITGVDIVKEQFHIAAGEELSIEQSQIRMNGAAIECRISAEDPQSDFVPSTGRITMLNEPSGPGVRVDSGVYEGFEVPVHYDPLIAKLLVWAPTREQAIARMRRALSEYRISGIKTTIPFHKKVMDNNFFLQGNYDTTFVDKKLNKTKYKKGNPKIAAIGMIIGQKLNDRNAVAVYEKKKNNSWRLQGRQQNMRDR